jgi:putative transposase
MGRKRPPRIAGFDYIGLHAYFLTICVEHRRQAFGDPACARGVCAEFLSTAAAYGLAVIAYCVMPDHVHALIEGLRPDADFRRFVSMFKQRSAFDYRRAKNRSFWQEGYFDYVLRDDDSLVGIAAYILNNPIRAGLCATMREYPFMGSECYTLDELSDAIQFKPPRGTRGACSRRIARSRP